MFNFLLCLPIIYYYYLLHIRKRDVYEIDIYISRQCPVHAAPVDVKRRKSQHIHIT